MIMFFLPVYSCDPDDITKVDLFFSLLNVSGGLFFFATLQIVNWLTRVEAPPSSK